MAQYLPLLAPCLAPQHLVTFANVRIIEQSLPGMWRLPETHGATFAHQHAAPPAGGTCEHRASMPLPITRGTADGEQADGEQAAGLAQAPHAFRYDAFPPWAYPDTWSFYCATCSRSYPCAEIKAIPVIHTVPSADHSP